MKLKTFHRVQQGVGVAVGVALAGAVEDALQRWLDFPGAGVAVTILAVAIGVELPKRGASGYVPVMAAMVNAERNRLDPFIALCYVVVGISRVGRQDDSFTTTLVTPCPSARCR